MSAPQPLQGKRIVVTRPVGQAVSLMEALQAQGAEALHLPMQRIESLLADDVGWAAQLAAAQADLWIVTSANAVSSLAGSPTPLPWPREVAAIGNATRVALAGLGVNAWTSASGSRSEDLLAEARLEAPADRRIAIIGGEGGRTLLQDELRARGAEVHKVAVYRRLPQEVTADDWATAVRNADAVVLTSAEAISRFHQLAVLHDAIAAAPPLWLVISPRLADHANSLGYAGSLVVADGPQDADVVHALTSHFGAAAPMTESSPVPTEPSAEAPEPTPAAAPPAPPVVVRRSGLAWFALFVAFLALLASAATLAAGYWLWQQGETRVQAQAEMLRAVEGRAAELRVEQRDAAALMQQVGAQTAALQLRMDSYDETLGQLRENAEGDRVRVTLASIEQLLLLANERLLLADDPGGAELALARADQRLVALADPRLHRVRDAIASERAALSAMPRYDREGISLTLASLIEQVDSLPLAPRIQHLPDPDFSGVDLGGDQPVLDRLRGIVQQLFVLRRSSGEVVGALPESAAATISLLMHSKLENVRAAWLAGDIADFQQGLTAAQLWLARHFAVEQPSVVAMESTLRSLQQQPRPVDPPDISRSLTLLRAQLEPSVR